MITDALFHYPPILLEMSEAMRHTMQASDWHEHATATQGDPEQRQQAELGNLEAALTRLKNAYNALVKRYNDIETGVRLQEHQQLTPEKVAERERYIDDQGIPIPSELRRAHPEVTGDGE